MCGFAVVELAGRAASGPPLPPLLPQGFATRGEERFVGLDSKRVRAGGAAG